MTQTHHLKTWPDVFEATLTGEKGHEYRLNDREYEVGDRLMLEEWRPSLEKPEEGEYTGRVAYAHVTYVSRGPEWGIPDGYAAMTIIVMWFRHGDGQTHYITRAQSTVTYGVKNDERREASDEES